MQTEMLQTAPVKWKHWINITTLMVKRYVRVKRPGLDQRFCEVRLLREMTAE